MNNLDEIHIYQKSPIKKILSIDDINNTFKKTPAIHVVSNQKIKIEGAQLSIGDTNFYIDQLKIFEVVQLMINAGVDAKISNPSYAMYPACLIEDFASEVVRIENINESPKDLLEYGIKYPKSIRDINTGVEFSLLEIYDSLSTYDGEIINMKLYGQVGDTTKVMYVERYIDYYIHVQSSKAINSHSLEDMSSPITLFSMTKALNNDI